MRGRDTTWKCMSVLKALDGERFALESCSPHWEVYILAHSYRKSVEILFSIFELRLHHA